MLLSIMEKDGGGVLIPSVNELSSGIGGIDDFPKRLEKFLIRNFLRVKGYLDTFNMLGFSGGNLLVGGIFDGSTGITGYDGEDAGDFFQVGLHAPEAASCQGSCFLILSRCRIGG